MLIGDARVSTSEQETAAQVTALKALTSEDPNVGKAELPHPVQRPGWVPTRMGAQERRMTSTKPT